MQKCYRAWVVLLLLVVGCESKPEATPKSTDKAGVEAPTTPGATPTTPGATPTPGAKPPKGVSCAAQVLETIEAECAASLGAETGFRCAEAINDTHVKMMMGKLDSTTARVACKEARPVIEGLLAAKTPSKATLPPACAPLTTLLAERCISPLPDKPRGLGECVTVLTYYREHRLNEGSFPTSVIEERCGMWLKQIEGATAP